MNHTPEELERARRVIAGLRSWEGLCAAEVTQRAAKISEMEQRYGLGVTGGPQPEPRPAEPKPKGKSRRSRANAPMEDEPDKPAVPEDYHYEPIVPYKGKPTPPTVVWDPKMRPLIRPYATPADRAAAAAAAKAARPTLRQRVRALPVTFPAWCGRMRQLIRFTWAAAGDAVRGEPPNG